MPTYVDMVNRIADEALRPDLANQIRTAIREAIRHHELERFWFNQFRDRVFQTAPGQEFYGAADSADIADILALDAVTLEVGATRSPLIQAGYGEIEDISINSSARSRPTHYAYWGRQIRLYPIPASILALRLSGLFRLPLLVNDLDENAWTNEAEALIRARACATIYGHYLKDDAGAQRASNLEAQALEALKSSTSRREATGSIGSSL